MASRMNFADSLMDRTDTVTLAARDVSPIRLTVKLTFTFYHWLDRRRNQALSYASLRLRVSAV